MNLMFTGGVDCRAEGRWVEGNGRTGERGNWLRYEIKNKCKNYSNAITFSNSFRCQ